MSGGVTATAQTSGTSSNIMAVSTMFATLNTLQEEVSIVKSSVSGSKQHQAKKSTSKSIDRIVNQCFASSTANGNCNQQQEHPSSNRHPESSLNSNKSARAARSQAGTIKADVNIDQVEPTTSGQSAENPNRYHPDEFNRMRERLFRLLSKVPIQVETLATDAPTASQTHGASSSEALWEPLVIKYYHERSMTDILNLHFGCSLFKHQHELANLQNQSRNLAQQHLQHLDRPFYDTTIYGPADGCRQQLGVHDFEQNNGRLVQRDESNNNNQPLHHQYHHNQPEQSHHSSSSSSNSYHQTTHVAWQHQHQQLQNYNWQPRAAFTSSPSSSSPSTGASKLASSQVKTSLASATNNNVSHHHHHHHHQQQQQHHLHHHRRCQSATVVAKVDRRALVLDATKSAMKAKRMPAAKRQPTADDQATGSDAPAMPSIAANMITTASQHLEGVNLSSGRQIYQQSSADSLGHQLEDIKSKYGEFIGDPFAADCQTQPPQSVQPIFDLYNSEQLPSATNNQHYVTYQPSQQIGSEQISVGLDCSATSFARPDAATISVTLGDQYIRYEQQVPQHQLSGMPGIGQMLVEGHVANHQQPAYYHACQQPNAPEYQPPAIAVAAAADCSGWNHRGLALTEHHLNEQVHLPQQPSPIHLQPIQQQQQQQQHPNQQQHMIDHQHAANGVSNESYETPATATAYPQANLQPNQSGIYMLYTATDCHPTTTSIHQYHQPMSVDGLDMLHHHHQHNHHQHRQHSSSGAT